MKRFELRMALIRTVVGILALIIAGIHLWLFISYVL